MRNLTALLLSLTLGGCSLGTSALEAVGLSAPQAEQVSTNVLALGTLGCQAGPLIAAVEGVTVTNATAGAVAAACSVISVAGSPVTGAVPVPLPAGSIPVATVPVPIAAAVAASVKPAT